MADTMSCLKSYAMAAATGRHHAIAVCTAFSVVAVAQLHSALTPTLWRGSLGLVIAAWLPVVWLAWRRLTPSTRTATPATSATLAIDEQPSRSHEGHVAGGQGWSHGQRRLVMGLCGGVALTAAVGDTTGLSLHAPVVLGLGIATMRQLVLAASARVARALLRTRCCYNALGGHGSGSGGADMALPLRALPAGRREGARGITRVAGNQTNPDADRTLAAAAHTVRVLASPLLAATLLVAPPGWLYACVVYALCTCIWESCKAHVATAPVGLCLWVCLFEGLLARKLHLDSPMYSALNIAVVAALLALAARRGGHLGAGDGDRGSGSGIGGSGAGSAIDGESGISGGQRAKRTSPSRVSASTSGSFVAQLRGAVAIVPILALVCGTLLYWSLLSTNPWWVRDPYMNKYTQMDPAALGPQLTLNATSVRVPDDVDAAAHPVFRSYPVVLKPAECTSSSVNVELAHSRAEVLAYLSERDRRGHERVTVAQSFAPGRAEVNLMYCRFPYASTGAVKTVGVRPPTPDGLFHKYGITTRNDLISPDLAALLDDISVRRLPGFVCGRIDALVERLVDVSQPLPGHRRADGSVSGGLGIIEFNVNAIGDIDEKPGLVTPCPNCGYGPAYGGLAQVLRQVRTGLLQWYVGVMNIVLGNVGLVEAAAAWAKVAERDSMCRRDNPGQHHRWWAHT